LGLSCILVAGQTRQPYQSAQCNLTAGCCPTLTNRRSYVAPSAARQNRNVRRQQFERLDVYTLGIYTRRCGSHGTRLSASGT
jgi:hypothetical protein